MKIAFFLLLCLCALQLSLVSSGRLRERISQARQAWRCRMHQQCQASQTNQPVENTLEVANTNRIDGPSQTVAPSIDVRGPELTSTAPIAATVPGGRRIIAVGSNCPEGYRADSKGNCREEY